MQLAKPIIDCIWGPYRGVRGRWARFRGILWQRKINRQLRKLGRDADRRRGKHIPPSRVFGG